MAAANRWDDYYYGDGTYGAAPASDWRYRSLPNVTDEYAKREHALKRDSRPKRRNINRGPRMTVNGKLRFRCLIVVILLAALSMALTIHRGISADRAYQLVQTRRAAAQLERDNEALRVEIALLKSPKRIKEVAEQQLGMIVPDNAYFSTGGTEKQ